MRHIHHLSDGRSTSGTTFHEFRSVDTASNLDSRGINYRQQVCIFLPEPKTPAVIRQLGHPVAISSRFHRRQRTDRLYILSDFVPFVLVKDYNLSKQFSSDCIYA